MSLLCRLLPLPFVFSLAAAQAPAPPPANPGAPATPANPGAPAAAEAPATAPTPGAPAVTPNPNPVPAPPVPTVPGATPGTTPGRTPGTLPGRTTPGRGPGGITPGTLPGGPPAPTSVVPSPANAPKPGVPLGENKIVEPVEYPTLSGTELAALYRSYTGRRIIVVAAAAAAEFSFVQDASPQDPLTYAQAAKLLRKAANLEGFVFVKDQEDPNLEVLDIKRPQGDGYDIYNESDELPQGDSVISYVMTFKHIKPETAAQAFTQIIGQFGTYGSIAPMNGSVIITENTSLIRRLIKLKAEIDKPDDISATRFITVKYADVTELSTTLNELLNSQQQAQKATTVQRAPTPTPTPGAPQPATNISIAGGAATSIDTPVQIVPEPRTNRIFAMGRPVDILFVEGLVREFDIETSEKTFLRRKLRFLAVADFLPVAENALNRAFSGTGEGAAGGGASPTQGGQSQSNRTTSSNSRTSGSRTNSSSSRNSSFGNSSTTGNNSFGGGGQSSFGSGGGGAGGSSLGEPNVTTAPESRLVGRTLLVADNITNSIVVQGPPSGLEIVERLLDQIDVKADQVMISTVIGQLNLTDNMEYGMDYLFLGGDLLTRGGGGFGPIIPIDPQNTTTGTTTTTTTFNRGTLGSGGGLRLYGKIGEDLHVYMKALQDKGDFTVLARPSIFTANNQKGIISSGERIAIPTNSNSYYQGGGSTQIQYQDVVLRLEVIPLINSEHEITLQISLLSDEVNGDQTVAGAGANGTDLVVPRITTREVLTTVTIPNNETIVLGGLITARNGEGEAGIPLLSSIPVLGKLFSTTTQEDERAELLVFLQSSIVNNRNSLDYVQRDADDRYKLSPDTRRFADGQGVLPPVDPAPVSDKASKAQPAPYPAPTQAQPTGGMKKSIRPSQVR